jgi:hypothetical protein
MDGSKRVIEQKSEDSETLTGAPVIPEQKEWTDTQIDSWLTEQSQEAQAIVSAFEVQAQKDFARIEIDQQTNIDQPTNNKILGLLNKAGQALRVFKDHIETIQENRKERKALKALHAQLVTLEYKDPIQALKLLQENLERIKATPENTAETPLSKFIHIESDLLERQMEKVMFDIEREPGNREKSIDAYHLYSSLGPENLLRPQHLKHGLSSKIVSFGRTVLNDLTQQIPDEQKRTEYIKEHNIDDLLLHSAKTPEERTAIVNTCVEKGIGRQHVLHGENRGIIPHLKSLDSATLSSEAKQQIFTDLLAVSADSPGQDNWSVCLLRFPELFLENMKTMTPEQRKTLEDAVGNMSIDEAKIALGLIQIAKNAGLSLEKLSDGSKGNAFFSLLKAGESTEEWVKQFDQFPDITNQFRHQFDSLRHAYSKAPTEEFVMLALRLPEKYKKMLPTEVLSDTLAYLLNHREGKDEQIEQLTSYPIDWGVVMSTFINSIGSDALSSSAEKQKELIPVSIQEQLKKNKNHVFETIFKKMMNRSLNFIPIASMDYLHNVIGTPEINPLVKSLANYAEEEPTQTDQTPVHLKLYRFAAIFDGLSEEYQQARDQQISLIGKEKFLTIALSEGQASLIKRLGDTEDMNWNTFFSSVDQKQKNEFLMQLVYNGITYSESMMEKIRPILAENKNALLHTDSTSISSNVYNFRRFHQQVPLEEADFESFISRIAKSAEIQQLQSLIDAFKNEQTLLRSGIEKNIDSLFAQAIIQKNTYVITTIEHLSQKLNWREVGKQINQTLNIIDLAQFTSAYPDLQPHIAWGKPLEQLKKTQQISKREVHCPWRSELIPLVKYATNNELLSMNKTEDGELFTNFVQEFGAFNLPKVFELFIAVKRTPTIEELSEKHKKWISDCLGEKAITKAQNPEALLNGLRKFQKDLQGGILQDRIPEGLETELGQEIFNAIRGSTKWARHDELGNLIKIWKETSEKNPDASKVAHGYAEKSYEIATVGESLLTDTEQQSQREKLLENKELQITLKRVMDTYRAGIQIKDLSAWWSEKQKNILDKWRMDLERTHVRQSQATSDVAKNSMQKNIDRLQAQINELLAIEAPRETDERAIATFLETIARAKKEDLGSALQELSAFHMNQVATGDWAEQMRTTVQDSTAVSPTGVERVGDFLTQYVAEHYLNKEQERHDHTQHTPFTPELTNSLLTVWQLKGDVNKHPIIQTTEKLHTLDKGQVLQKKVSVSFVPAKGLMRIFAGDIGDACYTSRYAELAGGRHEHLTSVLMVTNRGKGDERIEGSVLFIESETTEGESVLVVRANNPRENLLGKVDPDSLINASLSYAKEMAQARGIKKTSVIRDQATAASSNRGAVAAYYQTKFANAPSLTLTNTEETNFNGYNIWNPSSGHPVVEI